MGKVGKSKDLALSVSRRLPTLQEEEPSEAQLLRCVLTHQCIAGRRAPAVLRRSWRRMQGWSLYCFAWAQIIQTGPDARTQA